MLKMQLDAADTNTRTLTLRVRCHDDLGIAEWNGKLVDIVIHDLMDMQYSFRGAQIGREDITGWDRRETTLAESSRFGEHARKYAIDFNTGSEIYLICGEVTVHPIAVS
jgi:hypothetical protein